MNATNPLVSVVMPCFNARESLPLALASLLAQTYEEWECILVDDGSADSPRDVVEEANDPRIRFRRMEVNQGQGVVRQLALDQARGDFMCGLDADDWLYPDKLERQVEAVRGSRDVVLVGTGMSIVDAQGELVGVRSRGPQGDGMSVFGPFRGFLLPVASAPSLVRMDAARRARYDPSLRTTQDMDFFLQFLSGSRYGLLPDVSYVYTELTSVTRDKILRSLATTRRVVRKHGGGRPLRTGLEVGRTFAKEAVYRTAFAVGAGGALIARRAVPPAAADVEKFRAARAAVHALRERRFAAA
jgi:glycosyltransferase involved in cell wall biosynthesis